MKIAFLTPEYPHSKIKNAAGIGTSIFNLASELIKNKEHVTVFVYAQDKDEEFDDNGINIVKIASKKYTILGWLLYRKHIERVINNHILKSKIELLEAPDWTGITAFMKLKCPIVIRLHGSDTYFCHLEQRKQKWKNYWFEKLGLKKADSIISVSQFTAIKTKELFNIKSNIKIIHNGIDVEKFTRSERNLIEANSILYFGTLIRKKGLFELPYIFNEVVKLKSDVQLILVGKDASDISTGNSSTWELMKPLFSEEAINKVTFIGSVPYAKIKKYIEEANVCIFPTFAEALPVSWIEAMAMQKAIVASNIGWAIEVIDDGVNGYIVHPTNHKEYATKVVAILENNSLNVNFGIEARKKIMKRFAIEIVAKESMKFYKSIIENEKEIQKNSK